MSQYRTVPTTRTALPTVSLRGAAALVLSLLIGVAIGLALARTGTESLSVATVGGVALSNDQFLELNTTALEYSLSASSVTPVVEAEPRMDPFIYWNTEALEGLISGGASASDQADDSFLHWNVDSLEYSTTGDDGRAIGPR